MPLLKLYKPLFIIHAVKENTMAQWINIYWNSSFVNLIQLPLLCEKTGAITLMQPGFMAGWLAGRQNAVTFRDF